MTTINYQFAQLEAAALQLDLSCTTPEISTFRRHGSHERLKGSAVWKRIVNGRIVVTNRPRNHDQFQARYCGKVKFIRKDADLVQWLNKITR